jgi:hypothetical protein
MKMTVEEMEETSPKTLAGEVTEGILRSLDNLDDKAVTHEQSPLTSFEYQQGNQSVGEPIGDGVNPDLEKDHKQQHDFGEFKRLSDETKRETAEREVCAPEMARRLVVVEEGCNDLLNMDHPVLAEALMLATKPMGGPALPLVIQGDRHVAKVDTQATLNFVSSAIVQKYQIPYETVEGKVRMATPQHSANITGRCNLEAKLGDLHIEWEAWMVPSLNPDVILGVPFLREHRVIIDCDHRYMILGKEQSSTFAWGPQITPVNEAEGQDLPERVTIGRGGLERQIIEAVLRKHSKVFSDTVGQTRGVRYKIILTNTKPVCKKPYPYSKA